MVSVKAPQGQRTIQVVVSFWTDDIAREGPGYIVPKLAWDYGMVDIRAKKAHGIGSAEPVPFNSFDELPSAIKTAVERSGVTLKEPSSRRSR